MANIRTKRKFEALESTKEFVKAFRKEYTHITHNLTEQEIEIWLCQEHICYRTLESKMDLFHDYLLSQGLADVQE